MGGYVAHDAVASATRSPLSLKRPSMLTWTEKGERLDGEMHSINLFSDAYTRQVEALTQKSPFRRFIQSTHTDLTFLKKGSRSLWENHSSSLATASRVRKRPPWRNGSQQMRNSVLHLDGMYETLYDALACQMHARPPLLGPATFTILHYVTGSLLAAGQSVIVEGFWLFGSRKSRVSPTATGTRF
jgi:hypothetical protein